MFLLIATVCVAVAFLNFFRWGPFYLNPAWLFVFTQMLVVVGTIALIEERNAADRQYVFVLTSFMLCTLAGIGVAHSNRTRVARLNATPVQASRVSDGRKSQTYVIGVLVLSFVVSVLYFVAVGYSFFIDGIIALYRGESLGKDVSGLRLASYSGEKYFAPGYVNQFKNTLLPMLNAYLIMYGRITGSKIYNLVGILLMPFTAVFLVGNGQRGPLVLAAIIATIFFAACGLKASRKQIVVLVIVSLSLFSIGSVLNERVGRAKGWAEAVQDASGEVVHRVFVSNQFGGVMGFRFVSKEPIQWGYDWWMSLKSILPGRQANYIPIASRIHAYIFGSLRGTAPLTVPGSCWYNFGTLGTTLVPFLIGYFFHSVYLRFLAGPRVLLRVLMYSGIAAILGFWIAGDPRIMLDNGIPGILILALIYKRSAALSKT